MRWILLGGAGLLLAIATLVGAFCPVGAKYWIRLFVAVGAFVLVFCCQLGFSLLAPFTRFFGQIFFPGDEVIPPADYTLSKVYRRRGEFDRAAGHSLFILKYHPREARAYREGIAAAFLCGDRKMAERLLISARTCFSTAADRKRLQGIEAVYRQAEVLNQEDGFSTTAEALFGENNVGD